MIHTENLTRRFDGLVAVENVNLDVERGEVFGFLGPNGAGKTTTVRMLACLISPTSGRAYIANRQVGKENKDIRRSVGVLTETPGLYERFSAYRNLDFFAELYGVPNGERHAQVKKYLEMLDLWYRRDEAVGGFSKGMRQKLAIARALLHEPQVIFLDEPTASLDPEAAKTVRDFILGLKREKRTIFLCTHNLDEADRLCDKIGIIKRTVLRLAKPVDLRTQFYGHRIVMSLKHVDPGLLASLQTLSFVRDVQVDQNTLTMSVENPEEQNPLLIETVLKAGGKIISVAEVKHPLEDVYLRVMREAR